VCLQQARAIASHASHELCAGPLSSLSGPSLRCLAGVDDWGNLQADLTVDVSVSAWWFGTWLLFFHILGISSSQLTFIFFRGVETTNQCFDLFLYVEKMAAAFEDSQSP